MRHFMEREFSKTAERVAIIESDRSPNVPSAMSETRTMGMLVAGFTGASGWLSLFPAPQRSHS